MNNKLNFTVNNTSRDIQFIASEKGYFRVWVSGQTGFGVNQISDFNTCKGVLHAFTDMALVHRYGTHDTGLHLRPSIEKLASQVIMEEVGYVSSRYAGPIPVDGMEKLDDENPLSTNWGIVSFKNGRLNVVRKMWYVAGSKTESDEIKHWRHAIDLMNGFELLMSNCSLNLWPKTKDRVVESTGEVVDGKIVVDRVLSVALTTLQAPDRNMASEMIQERTARKQVRTSFARATSAIAKAADEGKEYVITGNIAVITDRKEMTIERREASTLTGLMGYLFKGKFALPGLQALDNPATLKAIKDNNLSVLIAA
jgi:hypothetical protein